MVQIPCNTFFFNFYPYLLYIIKIIRHYFRLGHVLFICSSRLSILAVKSSKSEKKLFSYAVKLRDFISYRSHVKSSYRLVRPTISFGDKNIPDSFFSFWTRPTVLRLKHGTSAVRSKNYLDPVFWSFSN